MFTGKLIAASFVAMLSVGWPLQFFLKRKAKAAVTVIGVLGLLAALYSVFAGLYLLTDWQDPFASADPSKLGHAAATHGGRGGLIILAIKFWPYVLIGLGGYVGYQIASMFYEARKYRHFS